MKHITLSIKLANTSLRAHSTRSILTMLGIVIGIALTISVMSIGSAIEAFVIGQVESFGSDVVSVEVRVPGTVNPAGIVITTLKEADAKAISQIQNIEAVYSGLLSQAAVAFGGVSKKTMLFGVSASYPQVDDAKVSSGRFFTESEEAGLARVAVIGQDLAKTFFGENDPINKFLRLNNSSYRIVGVLEPRGAAGFFDRDNIVYLPLKTLQKRVDGIDHVGFIVSKLKNKDLAAQTKLEIEKLMSERHRISDPEKYDFAVYTIEEAKEIVGKVILGIKILLICLAAISLVVGGVGIMNIMYVAVSERTYEIGLRKAVGAKNKDILLQFLAEAGILTTLGGAIGIVLGAGIAYAVAVVARLQGFSWEFIVSGGAIALAIGFSVSVGIIFGIYPARRAAKLEPVNALRYE